MENTYPHNTELDNGKPTSTHEIALIVKMNHGEAFILKEPIKLIYYRFDDTIIGTDGIFYGFYWENMYSFSKDAFASRKFTLTMHDGEQILCEGQWWDGISPTAKMLLDGSFVHASANGLQNLQNCYCYYGYTADEEKLKKLRATYTGPVFEYYEGEFIIKSWKKKHGKILKTFKDVNGALSLIDEHHDYYSTKVIKGKLYIAYHYHIKNDDWYNLVFTEGKKDFSIKQSRKKVEYHICKLCGADNATIPYIDNDFYCHLCDKEMQRED